MIIGKKKLIWTFVFLLLTGGGMFYFLMYAPGEITNLSEEDRQALKIMPLPAKLSFGNDTLFLPGSLGAEFEGYSNFTMQKAVNRFFKQISRHYSGKLSKSAGNAPFLIIQCGEGYACDTVGVPEQYTIDIDEDDITLNAPGPAGVLHGLETLLQLIETNRDHAWIRSVHIEDEPRYRWRGLMIDVCRHWIPKEVILRNLDAMASLKMNILHLHLSDYQAFRIECKTYPKLQEMGSDGNYYTQNDIKDIIEYAGDRAIMVIPEFDLPGHSTSWFAGYPELASMPGPYVPDTVFGILKPVMNPANEEVYVFLDRFFKEMSGLFPAPFLHIGGDEVDTEQWSENRKIQKFMREKGIINNHDLQAYFNQRLDTILGRYGKKMMGWDEILHPGLPSGVVVQSWRNQKSLFDAARKGARAVLSAGYYLDHKLHAGQHYRVDPAVMPGAVDIEPDTVHWKVYNLTMEISKTTFQTVLVLYGTPGQYRGFLSMMDNKTPFDSVVSEGRNLSFTTQSDYGDIKFQLSMDNDSIAGYGKIGFFTIDIKGVQTGGNDMPGTKPPAILRVKPLTQKEKTRILGGEACMWSELVDAMTIESRIWPRTAAIAEKLWSPGSLTQDEKDMYRRLIHIDKMLADRGLKNHEHYIIQLRDLVAGHDFRALKSFTDLLEEVKYYERMAIYKNLTVHTPLIRVVDAAWPESFQARAFNELAKKYTESPEDLNLKMALTDQLESWRDNHRQLLRISADSPRVRNIMPLSERLSGISTLLLGALNDGRIEPTARSKLNEWIRQAEKPVDGVMLAVIPGLKILSENFRDQ